MSKQLAEKAESLWRLVAAPAVWAAHFMLCYVTAAIWCAKFPSETDAFLTVRVTIGIYTTIALALITWVAWDGWRRHNHGESELPHDADTAPIRHRFLGFATLLLSGLSAIAVVFQMLPAVFIGSCQ